MIYVGENREYKKLSEAIDYASQGDTIFIDEGEYTENVQINVPLGINITGIGDVVININYESDNLNDAFFSLYSSNIENGNQTISNITFDGEFNSDICVLVRRRNNVVFENCTIRNFTKLGIVYKIHDWWLEPSSYATGNIVRNCIFKDCSRRTDYGQGAIWCHGQNNFLIHDNEFYLQDMPAGENGNIMMLVWVKGFKYYNNTSWKSYDEGEEWNIGIELWNSLGGNEIYNNTFNGGGAGAIIDIAGSSNTKGDYDYSWWIHHNTFEFETQKSLQLHSSCAITFESTNTDAIVSYNHIINLGKVFSVFEHALTDNQICNNITFCYNLCENIGFSNNSAGNFITLTNCLSGDVMSNIYIYNNTVKCYNANSGIRFVGAGTITNIYIYNNIIEGIKEYNEEIPGMLFGWMDFENYNPPNQPVEFSNIYVRNNIIYDNINDNNIYYWPDVSVNNLVLENNLYINPQYVSPYTNFHLQSNSPAIDAGIDVGLDVDFDNNEVGNPPCIGAYEYVE